MKKSLSGALLSALISCDYAFSKAFTTTLPIVEITTTRGQPINDEPSVANSSTETPNYDIGNTTVEWWDCSSQNFPKKSIGVELRQTAVETKNRAKNLVGLGMKNDRVLHASYTDKTFVRDVATMSRKTS
jgi:hypothetical protein